MPWWVPGSGLGDVTVEGSVVAAVAAVGEGAGPRETAERAGAAPAAGAALAEHGGGAGPGPVPAMLLEGGIEQRADAILALLKKRQPEKIEGMDSSLHYLAPHIPKVTWSSLGDAVTANEKSSAGAVDGSRWISLRLDGSGFSRAVKIMRSRKILEEAEGFSETFALCMQTCLRSLMEHLHARVGYTQSDEMILFIAPANVVHGEQQVHYRGGRVTKLTTLAASYATAHFVVSLAKSCFERGVDLEALGIVLPHFDCRLGHYASWAEARALLLWRAQDCSVNGVADAVYQMKAGKQVMNSDKRQKTEWLWRNGKLPLPRHQAYGTVLVKVRRMIRGFNPKEGTETTALRSVIEQVEGPVLELFRQDALIPPDESADGDA